MNCYVHEENQAIGTCIGCGKFICDTCNTEIANKNYCKKCVNNLVSENDKKIDKLQNDNKQPMVFMNAGGASSSSSSSAVVNSVSPSGYNEEYLVYKSKVTAFLLALFLGGIGIHKFYLNRPVQGIFYILFCWTYIPSIIAFIEAIIYICTDERTFQAKYGRRFH